LVFGGYNSGAVCYTASMKILRIISLSFSILSLVLFVTVYFGTGHMNEAHYDIGSGIWMLGDIVRASAILGIILAIPAILKRDKDAFIAICICLLAFGLLYATGWHAFVHHGV
jgi:hypothetical protein